MRTKDIADTTQEISTTARESGRDWLHYIKTHPGQSFLFGITILYAIKGALD